MKTYAVFAPEGSVFPQHESRIAIIKNGFSLKGFLFGPLWLFVHRLWLSGLLFLAADIALALAAATGRLPIGAALALALIGQFLIGLEGSSWRQRKLLKKGYCLQDVIGAYSHTEALVSTLNRAGRQVFKNYGAPSEGTRA